MMNKNERFSNRLGYAWSGLQFVLAENSFRTHLVFAILAYVALGILQVDLMWWALVTLVIVCVLAAEVFNTAIEAVCDLVNPERHPQVKKIKDLGAGAVLIISIGAVVIGMLLIMDKFV
jgi:diacylglycerol kinase (ATP)